MLHQPVVSLHSGYRKILINYATKNMIQEQKANIKTGLRWGKFDEVICYGPQDIDAEFYEKNRSILTEKRGAGYWLWKPYVILKTLQQMKSGDYLFYADASAFFIGPIDPLIHSTAKAGSEIAVCSHIRKVKEWTKRDALILMDMDKPAHLNEHSLQASNILLKKSDKTVNLVKEWLKLCCDKRLVADDENVMGKPNYPEFVEHKHDQSLFTLLFIKHGFMNRSYIRIDQRHPVVGTLAYNMDCLIPVIITRRRNLTAIRTTVSKLLETNVSLIRLIVRICGIIRYIDGQKQAENDICMDKVRLAYKNIMKWNHFCSRIFKH